MEVQGGLQQYLLVCGKINNSYNSGIIQTEARDLGGIVGENMGELYNCANLGNILGKENNLSESLSVGGIVGDLSNPASDEVEPSKIIKCYNWGKVENKKDSNAQGGIGCSITARSYILEENYYLKTSATKPFAYEYKTDVPGKLEALEESQMPKVIDVIQKQVEIDGNMVNVWKEDTQNINNGYPILYWE